MGGHSSVHVVPSPVVHVCVLLLQLLELLVGEVLQYEVVLVVVERAGGAARLVDAVVVAVVSDALAAAVLEPPACGRAHRLAARLALVVAHALAEEDHVALHGHQHRLLREHHSLLLADDDVVAAGSRTLDVVVALLLFRLCIHGHVIEFAWYSEHILRITSN